MDSNRSKPTIILVQGSFQPPAAYDTFTKSLRAHGFTVILPPLPSLNNHDSPDFAKKDLASDASMIQAEAERLIVEQGRDIMLVMHSYGGLVGSEAIPEDLSARERRKKGLKGGVVHLFYYTAFILDKGQSVLGTFGESPNNIIKADGRFSMKDTANKVYHDLPGSEAANWESKLVDQSYAVQQTVLTRAAYQYISSTYIISEDDRAVPVQFQEMFAAKAGAKVKKIMAGHSPQLSKPNELADFVEEVAIAATASDDV